MMDFIHWEDIVRAGTVDEPVSVWIPSEDVLCHTVTVPPVSRKKWQAMIPWLMEEYLLDKPEDTTFITGEPTGRQVPVVAVATARVTEWRQQLEKRSVRYVDLVPDFFALPWQPGELVIAFKGDRCLLRFGEYAGAAGLPSLILPLLQNVQSKDNLSLVLYGEGDLSHLPPSLQGQVEQRKRDHLFEAPAQPSFSLFKAEQTQSRPCFPLPAVIAASLAAVALILLAMGSWLETRHINQQANSVEDQLKRGFRQYFGNDYDFAMADFQRVVSRQIEGQSMADGITHPLRTLAQGLGLCDDCNLASIHYREGDLEAVVTGSDVASQLADVNDIEVIQEEGAWLIRMSRGVGQ